MITVLHDQTPDEMYQVKSSTIDYNGGPYQNMDIYPDEALHIVIVPEVNAAAM